MKLEIRILIASAFVSLSVQAVTSADAIDCDKILPKATSLQGGDETKETDSLNFNKRQKQELADLWAATLLRSQDIQFVVQKLMPNNNDKTSNVLMYSINNAVFGGIGERRFTPVRQMIMWPVGGMVSLLESPQLDRVSAKKARLNETETIMLLKIVRDTADRLVSDYKDYSQVMQVLVNDHNTNESEMKHALVCRDSLVGLAGEEAVTKLDESNGFTKLVKQFEVKSQ